METKNKTKFIKMIDGFIGDSDIEGMDEALDFLNFGDHEFDEKFIKFVLGYTMIYDRDLSNWKKLQNKYYSSV